VRALSLLGPLGLSVLVACGEGRSQQGPEPEPPYVPPPEACDAPSLDAPYAFAPCSEGSGIFGSWSLDGLGLPGYDYGLDQHADLRAAFVNTEGLDRRDHWHAIGNERVNALFSNDGYVELATQDRGLSYVSKYDAASGNFAGGYGFVDDGEETWSTLYASRPPGSIARRRFGMGYAESELTHREVRVLRRTWAPDGDAPFVLSDVVLENLSGAPKTLRTYEHWDVGRRPIEIEWVASDDPFEGISQQLRDKRDGQNARLDEVVTFDAAASRLELRRSFADGVEPPPADEPSPFEERPGDPFLSLLAGPAVRDTFTEQAVFFGDGGLHAPSAVGARASGEGASSGPRGAPKSGLGQPRTFVLAHDVELAPGEATTLRYAFGYAPMGEPVTLDPTLADPGRDLLRERSLALAGRLLYLAIDGEPALHRELAWHASQLEVSVGRREYFAPEPGGPAVRVVPQGSAYLYLHGADGAARDLGLFAAPLVYTHPSLARDELAMNMMVTHEDGRISYAFQGHGMLDDALGFHAAPSDLTLFFLWALAEYVGATGDVAFLDAPMPFYPLATSAPATTWDHVTLAVRHLFDVVGTGEHGLVRVQTGDWSDGIVVEAPDRELAIAAGESVPNTLMAIAILPRVAELVAARDPALAQEITSRVSALGEAVVTGGWAGDFYGRAYFGDGVLRYADVPNLEAQVWALVGDTFPDEGDGGAGARGRTLAAIEAELDLPSPTGATLLPDGQVWPAVSCLLTEGYAVTDPERALSHLARNTMAAHAKAFPEVWYGIWSGPDGLWSSGGPLPGQAWWSQVTPMSDFPTMNNNQHAMPLYAALRLAGLRARGDGLSVEPRLPRDFTLRTQLVDLEVRGGAVRGVWRPVPGVPRTLRLAPPPGGSLGQVKVGGQTIVPAPGASSIEVTVTSDGEGVAFELGA
jgi:hypothetical protein